MSLIDWLADFIFDQEIFPSGYTIFRKDRSSRGGGVLVAVSDTIPASVVPSHSLHACPSHKDLEILSIFVKFEKNQILLCCVYIPPNVNDIYLASNISCLSQTIHSHSNSSIISSIPSIIIGDFNLPDIQWDTLTASSSNSGSFWDFVFDNALVQLIHEPTHTKGNILHLVLTNDNDLVTNATVNLSNHHLSTDRYLISFKLSHPVQPSLQVQTRSRYVLDYPKPNYDAICSYLLDYDFMSCLQSQDAEHIWTIIKNAIYEGMNMFIPKVRIRRYQYSCWFSSELRHLSKCLRTLRKRISKHPSPYLQSKLVSQESDLRYKIQHAKSYYEAQIVRSFPGSSNSKIYNYIHSLSNASSIPSTVFLDSQSASFDISRAELFNTFFHSIYTVSSFSLPSVDNHAATLPTISNVSFSEVEVLHAQSALDPTKSMGTDRIGPRLLRSCSLSLYIPLHHLFSVIITSGIIPTEWKCHSITPVFKTGDKSLVKNYRPISLLCVTSKVLERLIYDRLCNTIHHRTQHHLLLSIWLSTTPFNCSTTPIFE